MSRPGFWVERHGRAALDVAHHRVANAVGDVPAQGGHSLAADGGGTPRLGLVIPPVFRLSTSSPGILGRARASPATRAGDSSLAHEAETQPRLLFTR